MFFRNSIKKTDNYSTSDPFSDLLYIICLKINGVLPEVTPRYKS
jgi:hypothetical protein